MSPGGDEFDLLEPFLRHMGGSGIRISEEGAHVTLDLDARHTNRFDVAHGGVAMTLLDYAMAHACRAADEKRRSPITIEMKVSFLRPGRGTLHCVGTCVHNTRTLAFGEGQVVDSSGAVVCRASGTYKYVNPR